MSAVMHQLPQFECLLPADKNLMAAAINTFGSGDHPWADGSTLSFFAQDYTLDCLYAARNMTVVGDVRMKSLVRSIKMLEASKP